MVTQTIKCSLLNERPDNDIIFRQGEVGREIEFEVIDRNDHSISLTAFDVTFSVYKPDGNFVVVDATVDGTHASIIESEQMTAVCGTGFFDLTLASAGEIVYTFKGIVKIDNPIVNDDTINSVSMIFGLRFPEDFQVKLVAGDNITIIGNVISATGGGGSSYTAGDYISIVNNIIDVKENLLSIINGKASASDLLALTNIVSGKADESDLDALETVVNGKANQSDLSALTTVVNGKQDALTAGENISIVGNVISATGGGDIEVKHFTFYSENYTDTMLDITKLSNNLCLVKLETTFSSHNAGTGFKYITLNVSDNERPYLPPANSYITFPCIRGSEANTAILRTESDQNLYLRVYSLGGTEVNKQSGQTYTLYGVYMARGNV